MNVAHGFAHELFHGWNSRRRIAPKTSGCIGSPKESQILGRSPCGDRAFGTSTVRRAGFRPVRNLTADRMVGQRKSDFNVERLPYQQGFLLASHWNADGRILDQAMRNLMKSNREPLSNRRIADALRAAGIANVASEIERFVMKGETIAPQAAHLGRLRGGIDAGGQTVRHGLRRGAIEEDQDHPRCQSRQQRMAGWRAGRTRVGHDGRGLGDPAYLAELEIRDGQGYAPRQVFSSGFECSQRTTVHDNLG